MNFRATKEQLDKANIVLDDNIVKVSGGGYVGVLSVYHELHCLVRHASCQNLWPQLAYISSGCAKKVHIAQTLLSKHDI